MRWNDPDRAADQAEPYILLAVAQSGSMAKAANELAVSHPVVSRSISELEHTLGVRLLDRNPHGVELTEYGHALLNRSHAAFDELRQGVKDIELLSDPTAGDVRIGSTAPLGASFVAAIIDRLLRRYPRMVFHIISEDANSLIRDLDERKLDLLILRKIGPFAEDRQSFEILYDNPYFVAAGTKNPSARRRRIELAELIGQPWVLPPPDSRFGSLAREIFDAQVRAPLLLATALEMTINLLRTNRYLAILPKSVFNFPAKHPFITKLSVELPIVSGPIEILTLKNRVLGPAAKLFVDCARGLAKPLARSK